MDGETKAAEAAASAGIEWRVFLETVAPGQWRDVRGSLDRERLNSVQAPELTLPCEGKGGCGGPRVFESRTAVSDSPIRGNTRLHTLRYTCRNCGRVDKVFSLLHERTPRVEGGDTVGLFACCAFKVGEHPPFGPRWPNKVLKLFEPDRDLLLRGRRAENQGLGIGAYAYYRRVVENHKDRLLDAILEVARTVKATPETIAALESGLKQARSERRFTEAIGAIVVPEPLRVSGHNPLTLLYDALSEGLHGQLSETECLGLAQDIRIVLSALVERISTVLKKDRELEEATSRLLERHKRRGETQSE